MHSQSYLDIYISILKNQDILESKPKIDSLLSDLHVKGREFEFAEIAHAYSIELLKFNELPLAIRYAKKEVENLQKSYSNTLNYNNALYNLGCFYNYNGDYVESLATLKKLALNRGGDNFTASAHCVIGENYYELGDYFRSVLYYEKGIRDLTLANQGEELINHYLNLSAIYEELNTKESLAKMLICLKKVDSLSIIKPFKSQDFFILNNSYADYYNNKSNFNFKKSKEYYDRTITAANDTENADVLHAAYSNLGYLYNKVENDSAVFYIKKAIELNESDGGTYNILAEYHYINNNYSAALVAINRSIQIHLKNIPIAINTIKKEDLDAETDLYNLLLSVYKKAAILIRIYEKDCLTENLNNASKNILLADDIIDLLYNESIEDSSKLYWRKEASSVYTLGLYIAELTGDNESALRYMEKNRALILIEEIIKNLQREALPTEFREKDVVFRRQISNIENLLLSDNTKALQDSLFFSKLDYQKFLDSISKNEEILQAEYVPAILSLKEIQDNLKDDEIIISYLWNPTDKFSKAIFTLWISNNDVVLQKTGNTFNILEEIDYLEKSIKLPINTASDKKNYFQKSNGLFKNLFPTEEIKNLIENKHLVILPDGPLQNIPFEILICNEKAESYLVTKNSISYAYSISYLTRNNQIERNPNNNYIGFAPVNFNYDNLSVLRNTKNEVIETSKVFKGEVVFNKNASKLSFLNNSNNYKIIHLATHAESINNPWVAFSDDKLYLNEIYTSKNQAELVVLSGCNTSLGEVALGEGVLSLARGFFHAGANSVISNAWEANDKSTSEIMKSFYGYLGIGDSKAKALQKAKIDYLNTHTLSDLSPHYWASFMLEGDYGKISENVSFFEMYKYLLVLAIPLVLIFILIIRSKSK